MKPRDHQQHHGHPHTVPRVMASAPSVVQQARLMDAAGTAWHAVKCGNLEMITKLFPNQCNVYAKGPVGENVMHVAMLLNTPSTLAITRYLVKLYGSQLVNCPTQERTKAHDPPGTYEGQTALHIAIVNRDFDMVKFLVQNGADIRARAWGTFFRQDGPMYYGEFPLSFAACTGQKDVVAYLKRHGAQVNTDCDVFGNTALHLCVIHTQPDMYDFLVEYCAASDGVRNHGGLTPLVLAAHLGKMDMLQHIYSRRRRAFYSFGKVTSYSLALREIDTVQDEEEASGPDGGYVPNALEAVLRKRHLDMLQEPLLTTLLQHKWEAFARTQFVLHFLGYLLLEVSQTLLIWMHSDQALWNGPARASQEFLGVILALVMLAVELMDYIQWSRECYHRRLTMTVHKELDPPLYPIPGEMRDARDNRQGLFARISARMGFAGTSSSQSYPGGPSAGSNTSSLQQRSDGGFGTPRGQSPPRGVSYPGAAAAGGAPSTFAFAASLPGGVGAAGDRDGGGDGDSPGSLARLKAQKQRVAMDAPGSTQQGLGGSGTPRSIAAAAAAAAGAGFSRSPTHKGQMSPSRSDLQVHRKSHDDPIDLRPGMGGHVIGEGRSPQGIAVVDRGYTGAQAGPDSSGPQAAGPGSTRLSPGPLGEAREGPDSQAGPQQHQQEQQGSGAAAVRDDAAGPAAEAAAAAGPGQFFRPQPLSSTGDSSGDDDDDDGALDVVSVGVRTSRMRSQHLPESASSSGLAAAGGSGDASTAAAAIQGPARDSSRDRSVTFSDHPNVLGRSASGRSLAVAAGGSPRFAAGTLQQQQQQQQASMGAAATGQPGGGASPFLQAPLAAGPIGSLSTEGSGGGGAAGPPAAAGTGGGEIALGHYSRPSSRGLESWSTPPMSAVHGSADGSAAAGPIGSPIQFSPGGLSTSPSLKTGIPRARSFHGVSAGLAGISSLGSYSGSGDGSGGRSGASALAASGRAATVENMGNSSTPADPLHAVQMLERQRTRARSGGGDLPATHALKRTPATSRKTTKEPSGLSISQGGPGGLLGDGGVLDGGGGGGPGSGPVSPGANDGGSGGGGGALGGAADGGSKGDPEKGLAAAILDPHKSRLRAMLETTYEGCVRMLEDPWLFIWHLHLLLTMMHFLIWISSYGWVHGPGPHNAKVREFDDVIVSMMGLSGWLAVIYFFRGLKATGKLAVVLERCIIDVLKFVSLYVLWNLGFTLAFYTMQNGVQWVAGGREPSDHQGLVELSANEPDPFSSIGYTMVTLINLGTGLSHYEYSLTCKNEYVLSAVLCTIYYLLYMATVVLLLMNLLTAMIINTWNSTQTAAEANWKHRWAIYVVKAERRLPISWVQRLRLGQLTWDPYTHKPVYSHVFETVDDDKGLDAAKSSVDGQIKAVESLLEDLKKRRGSTS